MLQRRLRSLYSQLNIDASQFRQFCSGSVTLKSVLFDNFLIYRRNIMTLQVINWKTLTSYLTIIALAWYLEDNVNQIYLKCCATGVISGWLVL